LERDDSSDLLRSLERSNLLLVPLDRHGVSYRYHQLLHDFLAAELARTEPQLVPELHARATAWFVEQQLPELALEHAIAGGDAEQAATLFAGLANPTFGSGRVELVRRWLAWFDERDLLERFPQVALHGAWIEAVSGRPAAAERWAAVAAQGSPSDTMPDGSTFEGWSACLRALLCVDGPAQMREDARFGAEYIAPGSFLRVAALAFAAVAELLEGRGDAADASLAHTVDVAMYFGAHPAASASLALRAAIAIERQDWAAAEELSAEALEVVRRAHIEEYIYSIVVFAVAARVAVHRGDVARAREHVTRTARLRPLVTYAMPWMAYFLLQVAHAYVELADPAGARTVVREVRDVLQRRPNLGIVADQELALQGKIDLLRHSSIGASSLTAAELRVLPYLATHLSFREIGERLYVSRHTIKSQAVAVYRKLGVSSRSEAIERIKETGLLTQ
jgi:LuxR family maltose regulon positive regulatory protein